MSKKQKSTRPANILWKYFLKHNNEYIVQFVLIDVSEIIEAPAVQKVKVKEGATAAITCELVTPVQHVQWLKDYLPVPQSVQFEIKIAESGQYQLVVHDVTLEETAEYGVQIEGEYYPVAQLIVEG